MKLAIDLLVGVVSGAIIGSVVGLVLAPRKGAETRGILKDRTARIRDRVVNGGMLTK